MGLKEILGDELFNRVKGKMGEKELIVNDGSYIPRSRLGEEIDKKKAFESKVLEYEKQLQETQNVLKGSEEFKEKYEKLDKTFKETLKAKENELLNVNKKSAIREKLITSGAKNDKYLDLLMKNVDFDSVKMSDNNIEGLDNLIKDFKENYGDLFQESKIENNSGNNENNNNDSSANDGDDWTQLAQSLV